MTWSRIAGFRLVTREPERLLAFYAALGFEIGVSAPIPADDMARLGLPGGGTRWPMRLGSSFVDLDRYEAAGAPYPADADAASPVFQHLALVTSDPHEAWDRARTAGARPISRCSEPVTLPGSAGGVTAIKFRDPEGHPLELIAFPDAAGRGWPGQGLLGIDHSAISVSDTGASRAFYGRFGLRQSGSSLNHGPAQGRLDGLDEPEVDVVALTPTSSPPHLELLGYRRPVAKACGAAAADDVAATRIVWEAVAPGLVRDPDGHLHECVTA